LRLGEGGGGGGEGGGGETADIKSNNPHLTGWGKIWKGNHVDSVIISRLRSLQSSCASSSPTFGKVWGLFWEVGSCTPFARRPHVGMVPQTLKCRRRREHGSSCSCCMAGQIHRFPLNPAAALVTDSPTIIHQFLPWWSWYWHMLAVFLMMTISYYFHVRWLKPVAHVTHLVFLVYTAKETF
jgi:hypothetical protein